MLRSPYLARFGGPLAIVLTGVVMLCWSWGKWLDVLVDFGHELYVPWQLAQGKVLYSDIAHYNGPLSQYFNALVFGVFGASVRALVVCNLILLTALVWLLYRVLAALGSRLSAALGCVTFLTMFAFAHHVHTGNYNFVCPYAHEVTHGVLLSVVVVYCLMRYLRSRSLAWVLAVGFALGLCFLTKGEVFIGALLAALGGMRFALWAERPGRRRVINVTGCLAGSTLLPPLVAFCLLWTAMPAADALVATIGSWAHVFSEELTGLPFFRRGMGTLDLGSRIQALLGWTVVYGLVFGLPAALATRWPPTKRSRAIAIVIFVLALAALGLAARSVNWHNVFLPLPVIMLVAVVVAVAAIVRKVRARERPEQQVLLLIAALLALGLLAKIVLNVRAFHYGFALSMPAVVLLVVLLLDWVPAWIRRRGGEAGAFRAVTCAVWLVVILMHLHFTHSHFGRKRYPVGRGADAFLADARGLEVELALRKLSTLLQSGETLAALPEGCMLNYLLRRPNPTRYINLMGTEIAIFGETAISEAYYTRPPDILALVHKDTLEFGARFFGRDYATNLSSWVAENYRPVALIGSPPFRDGSFGIQILRRVRKPEKGDERDGSEDHTQ